MSSVRLQGVVKKYGLLEVVKSIDLDIHEGEFLTLLGPSGCGKTTTLRLIAGFIEATQGTIIIDDEDVTHVAPQHREIGMVFQDYALFPHMTIAENIGFGLQVRKNSKMDIDKRVSELLDMIHLSEIGDRYPSEVSGGQAQRIAVARAVAFAPRVLLMDEPLGALDLKLREIMQIELQRLQKELKITTVYVTHDQSEAMNMSDRIAVMNSGVIEQLGTAEEIYRHPESKFVADFIGKINLIDVDVIESGNESAVVEGNGVRFKVPASEKTSTGASVSVGLRPEHIHLMGSESSSESMNVINGTVRSKYFGGNILRTDIIISGGQEIVVESRPEEYEFDVGADISVSWDPKDCVVLTK